jgi:hypothetical protein
LAETGAGMLQAMTPRIELLWWQGCPSTPRTLADLRAALEQAGLDPAAIEVREISDHDQAQREGFPGSPTIRIDGVDPFPADDAVGLSCRIYRLSDGRPSPTPDPDQLRAALARAVAA